MLTGNRLGGLAFHRGSDTLHRRISVASLGAIALASAVKGLSEPI